MISININIIKNMQFYFTLIINWSPISTIEAIFIVFFNNKIFHYLAVNSGVIDPLGLIGSKDKVHNSKIRIEATPNKTT